MSLKYAQQEEFGSFIWYCGKKAADWQKLLGTSYQA